MPYRLEELGGAGPLFQAKGTICLIIKDEPVYPPPALPGPVSQGDLSGDPRSPWATLLSLDLDVGTARALPSPS